MTNAETISSRRLKSQHLNNGWALRRRKIWSRRLRIELLEQRSMLAVDSVSSIVFWDASVDLDPSAFGVGDRAHAIRLNKDADGIDQITTALAAYRNLQSVHVVSHGAQGLLQLGNRLVDPEALRSEHASLSRWAESFAENADILLYGCDVGGGERGRELVSALAQFTATDVAASTDRTGAPESGGDWNLEIATGSIESQADWLSQFASVYIGLLPITVYAAGDTGEENMDLLIDSRVVQSWSNVGGNAANRQFVAFSYNGASNVSPDRIRVAFTNDDYVEGAVDRNLRVDRIVVDSTTYQTEAPTVYSTGTWLPADGIIPGFRQSEFLHTDGYFQFAVNTGSMIQIFAAGEVGTESMAIQIDGSDAFTWQNIGAGAVAGNFVEFTYRAAGTIQPSQVRLAFTNDLYQPPIDLNLRVDKIIIDGVPYESESPSVYSTGTYVSSQNGIVPGFWQTEWLHANGYLQFGANSLRPGSLGLEASVYSVGEAGGTVPLSVVRTGGSDGAVSIDYKTTDGTASSGSDYGSVQGTLYFANGETRKTITVPVFNDSNKEPPEAFNLVIENPRGGASLLAPRTATVTIADNDLILPQFATFPNSSGIQLNGNATVTSNTLQLTPNLTSRKGTAFYNTPIPLNLATSFQSQFRFKTTGSTGGGDGFTFIVQNAATGATSLGSSGSGLAYGGIGKSFAIEFDTVMNSGEINNNHISVWRDGNMISSLVTKAVNIDFNSGSNVYVWVDYYGDADQLSLFVSSTSAKPTIPITTIPLDVFAIVGSQAYFGFGAATSTISNTHRILNWSLNLDRPTSPPVTPPTNLVNESVVSGLQEPVALEFSRDGRNFYIAQKDGKVIVARDGVKMATPFIDISGQVNNVTDRGLLDIALHPDFANSPYVYLLFTYDPPEVFQNLAHSLAGPDKPGNRAGRLIRVTANAATNYTSTVAGSEVVLLGTNSTWNNFNAFVNSTVDIGEPPGGVDANGAYIRDFIASDSESHSIGSLTFAPDGALFVSTGDGASYNTMDPRATRVQDVDSLSGKILRINPLTGQGYANNPFQNGDLNSNRSKVYQLGLRNPFRTAVNPVTGQLYIGDVGWTQWEELNSAPAGANFGWPYYEGGNGSNIRTGGYENLQQAQDFYNSGQIATPSIYALNHAADGINAIVMGEYYSGTTYPAHYRDNIFFSDLGQGIVRNARLDSDGRVASVETFAIGAAYVVQIVQGPDGNLYYVDLDDGKIGRWKFVAPAAATSTARSVAVTATPGPLASPIPSQTGAVPGVGSNTVPTSRSASGMYSEPDQQAAAGERVLATGTLTGKSIDKARAAPLVHSNSAPTLVSKAARTHGASSSNRLSDDELAAVWDGDWYLFSLKGHP